MSPISDRFTQEGQLLGLCTGCWVSLDLQLVATLLQCPCLWSLLFSLLFNYARRRGRKWEEVKGSLSGSLRGLWEQEWVSGWTQWMVCVCLRNRHACVIMGCVKLLTRAVSVLAGGPPCRLMLIVSFWNGGRASVLAQFPWTQMLWLRFACLG